MKSLRIEYFTHTLQSARYHKYQQSITYCNGSVINLLSLHVIIMDDELIQV